MNGIWRSPRAAGTKNKRMSNDNIGTQTTLFPEIDTFSVYEQPLNERIRSCLRLEHLFTTVESGLAGQSEWHARSAVIGMLDITDLVSRTDIKGELIKELERHHVKIAGLQGKPGVDENALATTLKTLEPIIVKLKANECQPGATIRADELINQVKQRVAIPGGTCNFDLPAFHHWLSKPIETRRHHLEIWLADLLIVHDAVHQILEILRESSRPRRISIEGGLHQQQLDGATPCQLVRLFLSDNLAIFPEISGGKHRFVVRFFRQPDTAGRPVQALEAISFELQCCGI